MYIGTKYVGDNMDYSTDHTYRVFLKINLLELYDEQTISVTSEIKLKVL